MPRHLYVVLLSLSTLAMIGLVAALRPAPAQPPAAPPQPAIAPPQPAAPPAPGQAPAGPAGPGGPAAIPPYFYWYNGERIALEPQPGRIAVLFEANVPEAQKPAVVEADAAIDRLQDVRLPSNYRLATARPQIVPEDPVVTARRIAARPGVRHASPVLRSEGRHDLVPSDQLLLRIKPGVAEADIQALLADENLEVLSRRAPEFPGRGPFLHVLISSPRGQSEPLAVADRLHADPRIEYADPDFICLNFQLAADTTCNDPLFCQPTTPTSATRWNLEKMKVPAAWSIAKCTHDTVIAFIDTGVDLGHEDLSGAIVGGYNFCNGNLTPPNDTVGHGTVVAGMACAVANNGIGLAGVSWGASLLPLKVADIMPNAVGQTGNTWIATTTDELAAALDYARNNGADVINNSWIYTPQPDIDEAVSDARSKGRGGRGCVVTAAAGNWEGTRTIGTIEYPARLPKCIAVGATDYRDYWILGWDSNLTTAGSEHGPQVDVVAPNARGDILGSELYQMISTDISGPAGLATTKTLGGGDYGLNYFSYAGGTSCSTGEVSGIAALLLGHNTDLTATQVQEIIAFSADDRPSADTFDTSGRDQYYGYGRVNAQAALLLANKTALICRNSNGVHQVSVDSDGNVATEDDLTSGAAMVALTPLASDSLVLRDNSLNVVARVTDTGDLVTSGCLLERISGELTAVSSDVWVQRGDGGNVVARIASNGTLYTKGRVLVGCRPDRLSSQGK